MSSHAHIGEFGVPDDEVLTVLSVIVHHDMDGRIHQLIHPLRPTYRAPDVPASARLRPDKSVLELEYCVPTGPMHFDQRASSDAKMKRMRHKGSEVPLKSCHFAGIVRDTALHLHPLHSLQIVRPDMAYLDTAEVPVKTPGGASSGPVKMSASFRRTDDRAMAARRSSFAHLKTVEEADAWVPLHPHGAQSERGVQLQTVLTADALQGLTSDDDYNAALERVDRELEPASGEQAARVYLTALASGREPGTGSAAAADGGKGSLGATSSAHVFRGPIAPLTPITMEDIRGKPAAIQVEEALRRVGTLTFERLIELAPSATSTKEVFELAARCARVVAGNFVIKSELLYKPHWTVRMAILQQHAIAQAAQSKASNAGGSSAAATTASQHANAYSRSLNAQHAFKHGALAKICAYRDYLLFRIWSEGHVVLPTALDTLSITPATFFAAIRHVGVSAPPEHQLFYLCAPEDSDFVAAFPAEVNKADKYWSKRGTDLVSFFSSGDVDGVPPMDTSHKDLPDDHETFKQLTKGRLTVEKPSGSEEAGTTRADTDTHATAASGAGAGVAAGGGSSGTSGGGGSSGSSSSSAGWSAPLPKVELSPDAVKLNGVVSAHQRKVLVSWVMSKVSSAAVVRREGLVAQLSVDRHSNKDLQAAYTLAETEASGHAPHLERCLAGLVEIGLSEKCVEIPGRGGMFVAASSSPAVDKYRTPIIRILAGSSGVRKKFIEDTLTAALGEAVPDAAVTRVLKEVGASSGSNWVLKSGEVVVRSSLAGAAEAALGGARR